MKDHQTQLFKTDYETRCDTFGCEENGEYFVGRPDGPLNTSHLLCRECTDSLIESVKEILNAPKEEVAEAVEYELDEVLEGIKTHAELDELIEEFKVKNIPNREQPGGKLSERKDAVRAALK